MMVKKEIFIIVCLIFLILIPCMPVPCNASEPGKGVTDAHAWRENKLFPADEGETDASFCSFRQKLLEAVRNRDTEFVLNVLDPKVVISPPDADGIVQDFGIEAFRKKWQPEHVFSPLWDEMAEILSLGGSFVDDNKKQFVAPYVHSLWPKDRDAAEYWAVIGNNISVREQPGLNSAVIASCSYEVLRAELTKNRKWIKVALPDGRTGYVFGQFIRNRNDYSIGFEKVNDRWFIKWFAGKDRGKTFPPAEP
ncbi:MAG: SH3 domain-containing protein [Desulfococcaceae bacterium]